MKRKTIKIELTPDQISKLWPLLEGLNDYNRQASTEGRTAILGRIEVEDTGKVRATTNWTLLTPAEASAVQTLLGGTGTIGKAPKKRRAAKKCGAIIYLGLGEEMKCGKPAVAIFDQGQPGEYPACRECSENFHPSHLTPMVA